MDQLAQAHDDIKAKLATWKERETELAETKANLRQASAKLKQAPKAKAPETDLSHLKKAVEQAREEVAEELLSVAEAKGGCSHCKE
jgi:hypothetical protein